MKEEDFKEIVVSKLNEIVKLLKISQNREIDKLIAEVIGNSEMKRNIYSLIDGSRTVSDITKLLKLKMPNVSAVLTEFHKYGLVTKEKRGNKTFYKKTWEGL